MRARPARPGARGLGLSRRDAAFAGDPEAIAPLTADPGHADWRIHGASSQPDALFLLLRPDVEPGHVPLDPGNDGWAPLDRDDLEAVVA